jgi:hypothetical protein
MWMRVTIAVAAGALALMAPAAALAQAPNQSDGRREMDAALAFVGQLGEALSIQIAGMKKLADAKPLLDSLTTPAAIQAGAPQIRALMAEARASVGQADSMLANVVVPNLGMGAFGPALSPATMLAEARDQNRKALALLADYDTMLAAAARGDRAAVLRTAPKLVEGSFLLMDGVAMTYRTRQAALPPSQSMHQVLGVGIQLYRAMTAAGRGWYNARVTGKADLAAATLRPQLADIARDVRPLARQGRVNLARELAELDRVAAAGLSRDDAATMARLRRASVEREKLFAIADDIAAWAEAGGGVTGAKLAAEAAPELMGALLPLEMRFHSVVAGQAAIAAGRGD